MSLFLIGDVNHHLVNVVPARILQCKLTIFPFLSSWFLYKLDKKKARAMRRRRAAHRPGDGVLAPGCRHLVAPAWVQ